LAVSENHYTTDLLDIHVPAEINLPASGNMFTLQGYNVKIIDTKILRVSNFISATKNVLTENELIELEL
jgi:hypothetical protein